MEDETIDVDEATDDEVIRARLPANVIDELTKRAFSPGTVRKLLRDCYYLGPVSIGTGGWVGAYANGKPGTGLRRPSGALYNFPRSWRFAAIVRALRTGLITHIGNGRFATTERGTAVLDQIDQCPEHEVRREPAVRKTTYVGNPNEEGVFQSHALITKCPECGDTEYSGGSLTIGYEPFEQDEEWVKYALEQVVGEGARVYADGQPIDGSGVPGSRCRQGGTGGDCDGGRRGASRADAARVGGSGGRRAVRSRSRVDPGERSVRAVRRDGRGRVPDGHG